MTADALNALSVRFAPATGSGFAGRIPPGHVRTPFYLRGCAGVVERVCGTYPNPEELAYARDGLPRQPLYRVRFRQADVWPDYGGESDDTLDVEIYQHWLEAVA